MRQNPDRHLCEQCFDTKSEFYRDSRMACMEAVCEVYGSGKHMKIYYACQNIEMLVV